MTAQAVITKCHRLKTTEMYFLIVLEAKSKIKMLAGLVSSEACLLGLQKASHNSHCVLIWSSLCAYTCLGANLFL